MPIASISTNGLKGMQQNTTLTLASNKYPQLSVTLEFRNHSPDDQSLLSFRRYAEPIIEKSGGLCYQVSTSMGCLYRNGKLNTLSGVVKSISIFTFSLMMKKLQKPNLFFSLILCGIKPER